MLRTLTEKLANLMPIYPDTNEVIIYEISNRFLRKIHKILGDGRFFIFYDGGDPDVYFDQYVETKSEAEIIAKHLCRDRPNPRVIYRKFGIIQLILMNLGIGKPVFE